MASYISGGNKVFSQHKTSKLVNKRTDGQMKSMKSCNDIRAWCLDGRERHKYLLGVIESSEKGDQSTSEDKMMRNMDAKMTGNLDAEKSSGEITMNKVLEEEPEIIVDYTRMKEDMSSDEDICKLEMLTQEYIETIGDMELELEDLKEERDSLIEKLHQIDLESNTNKKLLTDYMKLQEMYHEAMNKSKDKEAQLRRLCYRAQEGEVFRIERDLLREKLKNLRGILVENSIIKKQTSNLQLMAKEQEIIRVRSQQHVEQLNRENSMLRKSLASLQSQMCHKSNVCKLIKDLNKKENVIRYLATKLKQNTLAYNSRQDAYRYNMEVLQSSVNYLDKALQEETCFNTNLKRIIQNQAAQNNDCIYSQLSTQVCTETYVNR